MGESEIETGPAAVPDVAAMWGLSLPAGAEETAAPVEEMDELDRALFTEEQIQLRFRDLQIGSTLPQLIITRAVHDQLGQAIRRLRLGLKDPEAHKRMLDSL